MHVLKVTVFGTRNWPIESSTICMFCDLNFFSIPIEALLRSSLDLPHSLVPSISSSNFSELVMRLIFLQELLWLLFLYHSSPSTSCYITSLFCSVLRHGLLCCLCCYELSTLMKTYRSFLGFSLFAVCQNSCSC